MQRYFAHFGVQPNRRKGFVLSTDPFFVENVCDVVGRYLNAPEDTLVFSVSERVTVERDSSARFL